MVLLVLASVTVITLGYRSEDHGVIAFAKRSAHDAFSPVQRAVDDVMRPVASFLSGAVHASDLETQNARLRKQVGALERQVLARQALQNTVRSLEQLDGLPWLGGVPTVAAQVTALNPSDFVATVQLDKGTAAGVATGMPVVGGAGLVGQVIEAWSTGSTVRLVTDVQSSVGVRFGPGNDLALVQGSGLGRDLAVNLVAPGAQLSKGEVLTTSGLQHAEYPPDIPVARVRSVSSTPSATQQNVTAAPLADLAVLTYVDVLQWRPSP